MARKRSMKMVLVSGCFTVTMSMHWSRLAAMIWLCFERLEALRMM